MKKLNEVSLESIYTLHLSETSWGRETPGAKTFGRMEDDRSRYPSHESVAALAGTSPVPFQSGRYSRAHKRIACIKPFHATLYSFARQSTRFEAWAKEYYLRKRREGKSHSVAVRALSNIWVRIIHAIWVKREYYTPTKFLNARAVHQAHVGYGRGLRYLRPGHHVGRGGGIPGLWNAMRRGLSPPGIPNFKIYTLATYLIVFVKTLTCLATKITGFNHLFKQQCRTILVVAYLSM
ncbi:Transposase, IS116/IS110/IS902 [Moorella glycerini]|uniref:Transposase IS116/IS110/IS902 family protein n=1 Tax=Neomoorella stamsii TaxID=1266720 RepID=A0A9X7J0E8_9FIRM|nr:Transposase IS116/IS110/IS902 family protein [Moorella stamsii]CEP68987.1 Transposase, IS116/IS110/IS902 [Moorella glycerini]